MSFEEFLKSKKISVIDGRIEIGDAEKVVKLDFEYRTFQAKEGGLPEKFKSQADTVITADFDGMERENQNPEKFSCELVDEHKNYDEDTWGGGVKGTVKQVWDWDFLLDNPGAMAAIVEWIKSLNLTNWKKSMEEKIAEFENEEVNVQQVLDEQDERDRHSQHLEGPPDHVGGDSDGFE
jgi:hypothetical protein